MMPNRAVRAGESITLTGTCGGGYGKPLQRDPEQVRQDILDGYVSVKSAKANYGVILNRRGEVDSTATAKARKALRAGNGRSSRP